MFSKNRNMGKLNSVYTVWGRGYNLQKHIELNNIFQTDFAEGIYNQNSDIRKQ